MKEFDFNTVSNRSETGSIKWVETGKGERLENVYPFSTADMEFPAPQQIRNAVSAFAQKGFFCYTEPDEKYLGAVCAFMRRRHGFEVQSDWIVPTYGIVSALNTAIRALTKPGEGVIVQRPVYRPFFAAIENNGRKEANNALVFKNGTYEIDFENLEALCKDENNKMMLLCSPHNPVCRVWTRAELERVAELCYENGVILVSDEIHFDITRNKHTALLSLDEKFRKNTIVCTAVSKSFNIAGLSTSNIIIPNEELRNAFSAQIKRDGYSCINCVAYPATISAYTECDEWLDEMNRVVNENFDLLERYLKENIPGAFIAKHEGTYLAWMNVEFLNMNEDELRRFFAEEVGITPSFGTWFGEEGKGFVRLNIAVPKSLLEEKLELFKAACAKRA